MRYLLLFVIVFSALVVPLSAQEDVVECDTGAIPSLMTEQIALMDADPVSALFEIFQLAIQGIGDCTDQNYHFTSEAQGQNSVIGPLEMSAGVYIVTLTTDGTATVSPTAIGDTCGFDIITTIFIAFGGEAAGGDQKVVTMDDSCGVLWEFSNMGSPWTFDIVKTG